MAYFFFDNLIRLRDAIQVSGHPVKGQWWKFCDSTGAVVPDTIVFQGNFPIAL
jgi:hypothetical protein